MNGARAQAEGFGGWLLMVVIGQWLGLFRSILDFVWALPAYALQWKDPALRSATIGEVAIAFGLLAFMLYTTIMMNMKRREFPLLFRIELALFVLAPLLTTWWVSTATHKPVDKATFAGVALEAVIATIGASISVLYSLRSQRVRNTFIY